MPGEFIKFLLASDEGQKAWVEGGGAPGYKPAWSFPEFSDYIAPLTGDQKFNQIGAEAMEEIYSSIYRDPAGRQSSGNLE